MKSCVRRKCVKNVGDAHSCLLYTSDAADEIVEQTHAGDYLACLERDYDLNAQAQRIASNGMPACEELIREAESFLRGN